MKKIFVCALALAAFAACQKNEVIEVPQGTAIAFNTFVDKSTKVTEAEDITKANLTAFGVYGWRTADNTTEQIFNAQSVKADNGVCTYSPLQYWAVGYDYQFEAVAPEAGNALTVAPAVGGSTLTFTSDSETDLVWARPTPIAYQTAEAKTVELTFQHLLSRVMFRVHNQFPAGAAAELTVTNLVIKNAVSQATITPAAADRAWAPVANQVADIEYEEEALVNIEAGANASTEHQYLIPAELTSVEFDVTLTQGDVSNTYHHKIELSGEGVDPNAFIEIGRSLRINIVINPENVDPENALYPIEFSADVLAW